MEDILKLGGRRKQKTQGTAALCLEEGRLGLAAIRYNSSGLPQLQLSLSEAAVEADDSSLLIRLVAQHGLSGQSCINVLAPGNYQLIQTVLGDLDIDEKRQAARWQIGDRIDYAVEDAVVDIFDIPSFGSDRQPASYVVSADKKLLRQQLDVISASGLEPAVIDIPEFALRNICALFSEDQRGTAILLLLEDSGILVISRDETLYLVRGFNTGMSDLIPYADGDYEGLIEQLDAIVLEVQRSFDFCESNFTLPVVSRLLIAQTQQHIPAVISYLNEYLTTKVEAFSFADTLDVPEEYDPLELNRNLLAIGAALRRESD